jgi:hypothetical protein
MKEAESRIRGAEAEYFRKYGRPWVLIVHAGNRRY